MGPKLPQELPARQSSNRMHRRDVEPSHGTVGDSKLKYRLNACTIHMLQKKKSTRRCDSHTHHAGMATIYGKEWVTNAYIRHTDWTAILEKSNLSTSFCRIYEERIDCKASCCWGCKDDHVEAKADGGKVCCSCLNRLIIRFKVCSVARSLPHKTSANTVTILGRY